MISVILSTYNNEDTISDAINSIIKQSYTNFELIIINDASTDKTGQIIESFNDSRIIYLCNKRNLGRSRSRNNAIKICKGNFLAIMDGDDISCPDRFEVQFNYLINNPKIDLVASNVIYFYENRILGCSNFKLYKKNVFNYYLRASEMPHPTWMGRASFFKKFKYNPLMDRSEDSDLLFRARLSSQYSLLSACLVFYRIPYKINIIYKLNQVFLLFLSRAKLIFTENSYYYLPLIFFGLIASSVFYIFGFKSVKISRPKDLKYQNFLDKITKNTQLTIINVITSIKGGGAEAVINELDKIYVNKNLKSYVIYNVGDSHYLKKNHFHLSLNPRNPLSIFYLRKIFKKILSSTNKDVIIHAHLTWPFFFTFFATLGLKNYKLFFTEHSITNRRRKIPFFYLIDRFFFSKYLNIICISKGVYNKLSKWVGIKIKKRLIIIYNGAKLYSLNKRTEIINRKPRLISVGRLIPEKNFSTAIIAISKLKNDIESYTIIGVGSEQKNLELLVEKLNLKNKVKIIGWKKNVKKYFYKSDIQLIPSINEGFGLVAVEGMSTGLPVVASNIQGLKEVLGYRNPSVFLVNKIKSSEEWAIKISKVLQKIKILGAYKLAKFSNNQAKKFTFSQMAEEYLSIYKKIR